jgi:hypothetical protein
MGKFLKLAQLKVLNIQLKNEVQKKSERDNRFNLAPK